METSCIYFLKVNGLLFVFYLLYHFLLRKETFFVKNRYFLLFGLVASLLLPLVTFTKIIWIEVSSVSSEAFDVAPISNFKNIALSEKVIDWNRILFYVYFGICIALLFKIIIEILSFYKFIKVGKQEKYESFTLINHPKNTNPFSFLNYIVINKNTFSDQDFNHILAHEKVHVAQKHSVDVLISKLFCSIFWINPIVWMYKKSMIQNLEFIADNEACSQSQNQINYQKTLLQVVINPHQLTITNQFYQSLIKKRIVMLNKNQSKKRNLWKFAFLLPIVVAFVFLFQVKVVAQEKLIKLPDSSEISSMTKEVVEMNWDKNSPIEEFENDAKEAKKLDLNFTFSNIKRNKQNEITHITISYQDKLGNQNTKEFSEKDGINPIYFRRSFDQNGKGEIGFYAKATYKEIEYSASGDFKSIYNSHYESDTEDNLNRLFIINGKPYTKEDLKNKNIAVVDANIIKLKPNEAIKKYGSKAKDGAIIFEGKTEIIDNVLKEDLPPPPPPKPITVRELETKEDKNMLLIINGKEYFQKDLRTYNLKCDGSITHYLEEEAVKRYGKKAKYGVMIFNGTTKLEIISSTETNQERKEAELNAKQNSNLSENEIEARLIDRNKLIEERKKVLEERKKALEERKSEREKEFDKRKKVVDEKREKLKEDRK